MLVLANSSDPDSVAVARHYVERRGLPETAIVALPMPVAEQVTWGEFVEQIWNPLLREAIARDAIDAMAMRITDEMGRLKIASSGHRLDALVVCRGVPLRVAHDPAFADPRSSPLAANPALRSNEAAVDSELALLAVNPTPVLALVPNPLFSGAAALAAPDALFDDPLRQVIPVGRLDGPGVEEAKALVDRAIEAESGGLRGRAYVDIGGPHQQGDEWLDACVTELTALGFETDVDRERATLPAHARFDAPAIYVGWYAGNMNGPFTAPGFRFPAGAIALHIHSFSATTMRSSSQGWAGPLVARGVTATFGNVGEPYLQFTHQPHLLIRALRRGEPLGLAALRSINALGWKGILIGDPLYRPFAVSGEAQWEKREGLPPESEPYARIRRMRLLAAAGRGEEALSIGLDGMKKNPNLALALTLAGMQASTGDMAAARRTLGVFPLVSRWRPLDWPLVVAAARAFQAAGASGEATKLMERLLAENGLSEEFRLALLKEGAALARAAQDMPQALRWDAEFQRRSAPAAPASPAAGKAK